MPTLGGWCLLSLLLAQLLLASCTTFDDAESIKLADAGRDQQQSVEDMGQSCVETDDDACDRLGLDCGVHAVTSACGGTRTIQCGACNAPETCGGGGTEGVCGCTAEPDSAFCEGAGKDCGVVSVTDSCGTARDIDCGTCVAPTVCGQESDNVCGCPCRIAGVCRADGLRNPDNDCEVCDPAASTTEWTVREGACDDGDLCTTDDVCDATGTCVGVEKTCPDVGAQVDCQGQACNMSTGLCEPVVVDEGLGCSTDSLACTFDVCRSGACEHELIAGSCIIDGRCWMATDLDPSNPCKWCDPSVDTAGWTLRPTGESCPDNDALFCTAGECDAGACVPTLRADKCLINGTCYAAGQGPMNIACQYCDPAKSQSAFTLYPVGYSCRPAISPDCQCDASGSCVNVQVSGLCL